MNKPKEIMKAVGRYTDGYVANHWKEFLTGLLGGLAASAANTTRGRVPLPATMVGTGTRGITRAKRAA